MKKHTKKLLAVGILLCVVAVFAVIYGLTRPETAIGSKEITVEVVHGDGAVAEFAYQTDAEYLGEVLIEDGLIEGEEGAYGLYIKVVDGERADYDADGAYWAFYQGEEYATQGIDQTPIYDGDSFRLVYTYG